MNKWWGYVHRNGSVHIKRYFGELDIEEAVESPFVAFVIGVVEAIGREDAEKKLKAMLAERMKVI